MMNVLQIMNRVPWPLKDGGSIGYFNYAKGYHDAGCNLTVAAMNTSRHWVDMDTLPIAVKETADWRTCYIDNRVKPIPAFLNLFTGKSYHIERFISKDFEQLLVGLLREKSFDVIIFESLFTTPYIDIVRSHSKALLVLRQHNVEYRIWETLAAKEQNPLKKIYLGLLTRRLRKYESANLNACDAVTTVTENDKDVFHGMGCIRPIYVSPAGIDISRLHVNHSALEVPSVFHIGSMEWMPNRDAMNWFIRKVWQPVSEKYPDLRLYLAGRGMPASFKQLHIPNIIVEGEVEDAIAFMQSRQIMIVPLFAGSGIRVKILEGMALGKTIISTSLGAQGIACENGKHLLIADTAGEFITAIDKLMGNPQLASDLGVNARKLIDEQYDNTKVVTRLLGFYTEQKRSNGIHV
jgi:glycosyltransferase involved in cell wall biosynthesis